MLKQPHIPILLNLNLPNHKAILNIDLLILRIILMCDLLQHLEGLQYIAVHKVPRRLVEVAVYAEVEDRERAQHGQDYEVGLAACAGDDSDDHPAEFVGHEAQDDDPGGVQFGHELGDHGEQEDAHWGVRD